MLRRLIALVLAGLVAAGPAAAQADDPLAGSWTWSDPWGFVVARLNVTCNDVWRVTVDGADVLEGRGQARIFRRDGRYWIAEQPFRPEAAVTAVPLTVTPQPEGGYIFEWADSHEVVTPGRTEAGEDFLNLKGGRWSVYWQRCPGGEAPYTPPARTVESVMNCQILNMVLSERLAGQAVPAKRHEVRAEEWGRVLAALPKDPDAEVAVAKRWKAALADPATLDALVAQETQRCGGAPPGQAF